MYLYYSGSADKTAELPGKPDRQYNADAHMGYGQLWVGCMDGNVERLLLRCENGTGHSGLCGSFNRNPGDDKDFPVSVGELGRMGGNFKQLYMRNAPGERAGTRLSRRPGREDYQVAPRRLQWYASGALGRRKYLCSPAGLPLDDKFSNRNGECRAYGRFGMLMRRKGHL